MIPDDIQDLHFHTDDFKNGIEKEFAFLKETTHKNVENFQSSLSLQQTYSASLCLHVNNIYNKLAELQQQLPHPNLHMNTGDMIQIEAPDFDPDIDEVLPISMDQRISDPVTQGSVTPTLKSAEKVIEVRTPAPSHIDIDTQEVDWPDVIPVEIPPQYNQQNEQSIPTEPTYPNLGPAEIPQLKDNSEGENYQDLETYLSHHNMLEASERIHRDYRSRLLSLDDDKYYQEIDLKPMRHPQHRTTDWLIRLPVPTKLPKNQCKYLVRVGIKHMGKNSTDINLSAQE